MGFKIALVIFSVAILLILCAVGIFSLKLPAPSVEITEVRNDWGDILYAADGSGHGFIELYNNSAEAVCLDGWYLSDSTLNWDKYPISGCTIEPYSYAVFWTNDEADVAGLPVNGHFLGFSLRPQETAVLTNPSGRVLDKAVIPQLEKGTSYAKGATGIWGVRPSSPGAENSVRVGMTPVAVSVPSVSVPSGFYEESIRVKIQAPKDCKIYYTLDGTPPDTTSPCYTEPLVLTDPTSQENRYAMLQNISTFSVQGEVYTPQYAIPKIHVLRAIAVDADGNSSEEVNASYFIDFKERYGFQNVLTLSIISDPDNFFSDELGIYVLGDVWNRNPDTSYTNWIYAAPSNYNCSGKGWRRPAQLELFDEERNLLAEQSAGVSIHGGWSVVRSQKGFNLYAFSETEEDTILFPGVLNSDSSSVMLRPGGFRDLHSTKIRDILNQMLVADRDVTVQDGIPCQVFLNGEYWGLYNLQERISGGLITSNYNVNPNNLIILKNSIAVAGDPEDTALYRDLLSFVQHNDLTLDANYDVVCQLMDIQSYIDYYCFQIYVANCDSVSNNYARWRTKYAVDDQYGDGRWRWILYDTDDSTGMVEPLTNPETDSFSAGHFATTPLEDLLFSSLIKNENFKAQFVKTFEEMAVSCFSPDVVLAEIDRLCQIYMPATVVSHHRFIDATYTEQDYLEDIQVIKDFYINRYEHIHKHMIENLGLHDYDFSNQ